MSASWRCSSLLSVHRKLPKPWIPSRGSRGIRTSSETATTTSSSARRASPTPSPTSCLEFQVGFAVAVQLACHTGPWGYLGLKRVEECRLQLFCKACPGFLLQSHSVQNFGGSLKLVPELGPDPKSCAVGIMRRGFDWQSFGGSRVRLRTSGFPVVAVVSQGPFTCFGTLDFAVVTVLAAWLEGAAATQ